MPKKFLILNALVALSLMACNPASGKKKTPPPADATPVKTGEQDNPETPEGRVTSEGLVVKRAAQAIQKLELTRTEDSPLSLMLEIEPKIVEDTKTKAKQTQFVVSVKKYGPNSEASDVKMILPPSSDLYAPMLAIFEGKQALIHQAIPAGLMGAGTLSVRLTSVKEATQQLIVEEPALENGVEGYFGKVVQHVHAFMKNKKKKAVNPNEVVTDTDKDATACVGLDLLGDWSYDLSEGTLVRQVVSSLTKLETKDGSVQYSSRNVITEQGCFGPAATREEASVVRYEAKSCILYTQHKGKPIVAHQIQAVINLKGAKAGEKGELVGLKTQECKDTACNALAENSRPVELRREVAK